jgi:hypothetical protein
MTKKEISEHDRHRLPPLRPEGDGDLLRPHDGARLRQAFKAGISFGKDDMVVPDEAALIAETRALVKEFEQQYKDGLITAGREIQQGGRRLVEAAPTKSPRR